MMESEKNKTRILYLVRWYPNRYDPMPGLFIQRHAQAANKYCQVGVVYAHLVENEEAKEKYDIELAEINDVLTVKIYYKNPKTRLPLFSQALKIFRFYKANYLGMKIIRQQFGGFDLVHVHILTRLGLIALYFKWFFGKPFVISEHWSRYLALTGTFAGGLRKAVTKLVITNASAVTTVTQNLADAMQSHGLKNRNYRVLANVVDEPFFHPELSRKRNDGRRTIVHVSCFEDKSKNVSGLLRIIKLLSEERSDFVFRLIGDGMDFEILCRYSRELGLDETKVVFTGLLEGRQLVEEMAAADLMVVFSNYENFPVVINESFALGIPVLATSVGGIPEFVNKTNGRLLDAGDEKAMANLLRDFLDGKLMFDKERIQLQADKLFSSETIGRELFQMYDDVMDKSR